MPTVSEKKNYNTEISPGFRQIKVDEDLGNIAKGFLAILTDESPCNFTLPNQMQFPPSLIF